MRGPLEMPPGRTVMPATTHVNVRRRLLKAEYPRSREDASTDKFRWKGSDREPLPGISDVRVRDPIGEGGRPRSGGTS